MNDEDDEVYGVDKDHAHPNAIKLVTENFFWSNYDELAPFGSDEGDTALEEYRKWRLDNPKKPIKKCLNWCIRGIAEIKPSKYNKKILSEDLIKQQIQDDDFDDEYYIWTVDTTVIATGFAQLLDEGKIDDDAKPIIDLALSRQIIWMNIQEPDKPDGKYIKNLKYLKKLLTEA